MTTTMTTASTCTSDTNTTTNGVRRLVCAVCGEDAGRFAQHWNRDIGFGICRTCVVSLRKGGETESEIRLNYGVEGVNYAGPDYVEPDSNSRWLTAGQSARALRKALTRSFPATKFRVKLLRGTSAGFCDVYWTDGPSEHRVREVLALFETQRYDYTRNRWNFLGVEMPGGFKSGIKSVTTFRGLSLEFAKACARQVQEYFGGALPEPVFDVPPSGKGWTIRGGWDYLRVADMSWAGLIYRAAEDRSRYDARVRDGREF